MKRQFLFILATVLLSGVAHGDQVIVVDDDFSDGGDNYSVFSFNGVDLGGNDADVSLADFTVAGSGGNPGGVLLLTHSHDVDRDEFGDPINGNGQTELQSILDNQERFYDPTVNGNVASITYSLDYRTSDSVSEVFFDVTQDTGGGSGGFLSVNNNGDWQNVTVTLTEADFFGFEFSSNAMIGFGFGFFGSEFVFDSPADLLIEVDNFTVTVNAVPEPAAGGVILWFALAMIGRRQRRR